MSGDAAAFGRAYDQYAPTLYGLLLRIVRDAEDAREVLQETFLNAWSNASSFDPKRGSEIAWLITMARSRGIDRLRSRARRGQREDGAAREISRGPANVDSSDDFVYIKELRAAVVDAMRELPAEQRSALELAYFEGLSQSEIATRVGAPLGTIKTRILLGMKRLRERLGAFGKR